MYNLRFLILCLSFTVAMAVSANEKQVAKLLNEASEFELGNEPGLIEYYKISFNTYGLFHQH
jgi:hypothetical protein